MTMIRCNECGRAVSDQATSCIGCGAPIVKPENDKDSFFNVAPEPSNEPPLSKRQMNWRVALAVVTLILGVIAVGHADHSKGDRIKITLATLLLIGGLCWTIAAVLHRALIHRRT